MADDHVTSPHRVVGLVVRPSKMPALEDACLVVLYGESIGRRVALRDVPLTVGRANDADLQFEEESVSRHHCRFEPFSDEGGAERWRVVDLESTNGTFVNDRATASAVLQHGDRVQIGRTICKFLGSGQIEAAYYEEIYRLVTTDGLTGLCNRRAFTEALAREFGRSVRYGRPLGLVMLDIDHFKNLNDSFGHLAGDAALRQLGVTLRTNLRREDIVGRLGGEEFGLLLPELDLAGARLVSDKVRTLVASRGLEFEGAVMRLTVSAGVVARVDADADADDMMRRADALLYVAKRAGRNRTEG
jgi:two-component system cell cycle response regulator